MTTTHMLQTAEAEIAYDVRGPLPTADGRPQLFTIGQPMDASGFTTLASHVPDRTVDRGGAGVAGADPPEGREDIRCAPAAPAPHQLVA